MAYENKLDNSDVQLDKDSKDVVGGLYNSMAEAQAMKIYLDNLKTMVDLEDASGAAKTAYLTLGAKDREDSAKVSVAIAGKKGAIPIEVSVWDATAKATKQETRWVLATSLIPKDSEFERARKVIISKINAKSDEELRSLMARFDASSTFELSSKIANYVLDQRKRNSAFESWNAF
jgi:hypothetical protein